MIYSDRLRKSIIKKISLGTSRVEIGLRKSIFEYFSSMNLNQELICTQNFEILFNKYIEKVINFKLLKCDNVLIDQSTIDRESLYNRISILDEIIVNGDSLLFIGDNDFVSIILSYDERVKSITVVDLDDQVLQFISDNANNDKVVIIKEDFKEYLSRDKVPNYGTFQVVQSDPPYTETGFRLYNHIANCNIEFGGYFLLVVPDMEYEKWNYELKLDIQRSLVQGGFVVEKIFKHNQTFIDYYGIISSTWLLQKVMTGEIPNINNKKKLYTIR